MRRAATALALVAACVRGPAPPSAEVEALRRAVAGCPQELGDAVLDDLDAYARCRLPADVARMVRGEDVAADLDAPDWASLRHAAGDVPRAALEAQLRRFADPRGVLAGWIEVDAARDLLRPDPLLAPGIEVPFAARPPSPDPCSGPCTGRLVPPLHPDRPYRPERRAELLARATPGRPLAGLRVVVDPGHWGGRLSRFEERHLAWRPAPGAPEVVIREGDLTLRTAEELRSKLAALGADVVLTRGAAGPGPDRPLHALRPAAERLLRHVALDPAWRRLEDGLDAGERRRARAAVALLAVKGRARFETLRERARLAQRERGDLLLSIHYNATRDPPGLPGPQEIVAMVRGFPEAARASDPYHRLLTLRGALAVDEFDAAAHLARLCVDAVSDRLGVPPARPGRYADQLPIQAGDGSFTGVGAWDGALLRYAEVPAVLVEGPFMNERDELARLADALAAPPGTAGTRTERYADALAGCVAEWHRRWLASERNPFGPEW